MYLQGDIIYMIILQCYGQSLLMTVFDVYCYFESIKMGHDMFMTS